MTRTAKAQRHGERGQAVVLLAVASMVMAFTLLTTFSVGKAVREKIALQQAADASAYSLAVEEARAFNFYSYVNRATAAHYVAVMAIYGHMSEAASAQSYFGASYDAFCIQIQGATLQASYDSVCNDCPFCDWAACACGSVVLGLLQTAYGLDCLQASSDFGDKFKTGISNSVAPFPITPFTLSGSASQFMKDRVKEASNHVQDARLNGGNSGGGNQGRVDAAVLAALQTPGQFTDRIAKSFDPKFESLGLNGNGLSPNIAGLTSGNNVKTAPGYCDGVESDGCKALGVPNGATGANVFSTQHTAANDTRWQPIPVPEGGGDYTRDRQVSPIHPLQGYLKKYWIDNSWIRSGKVAVLGTGMSRMIKGNSTGDPENDLHATNDNEASGWRSAAHDHGTFAATDTTLGDICGSFPPAPGLSLATAWAYSEPKGNPNGSLGEYGIAFGDLKQFKTAVDDQQLDLGSCVDPNDSDTCGILQPQINFRISADNPSQLLFNQPRTFAAVQEQFTKDTWGPFGIKLDKAIKMFDPNLPSTYDNVVNDSSRQGRESLIAVSQGMTYYHRPGNWREPPNFYNPFWRAKLHPYSTRDEAASVAKAAGYTGASANNFYSQLPNTQ